jgi:hypothetical protein
MVIDMESIVVTWFSVFRNMQIDVIDIIVCLLVVW